MGGKAFHGAWCLLHLSALVIVVLIAWTALAEDGVRARAKLAFALVAVGMHGLSMGHHGRAYADL